MRGCGQPVGIASAHHSRSFVCSGPPAFGRLVLPPFAMELRVGKKYRLGRKIGPGVFDKLAAQYAAVFPGDELTDDDAISVLIHGLARSEYNGVYLPLQPGVLRLAPNAKTVTLCELKNDDFVLSGLPQPRQSRASGQWTASATGIAQSLPTSQSVVGVVEWQNCRAALDRGQLLPCRSQSRNGDCVDRRANSGLRRRRRLRRGAGAEAASPLAAHLSQRGERVAEGAAVQATRGRRGMRRQRRCCCGGGRHGLGLP